MNNELSIIPAAKELVRQSTDIAELCKNIVLASAVTIQSKKYVRVEGWQSIATAHGCIASAKDVSVVEGGISAIGEIRRMQDGQLIATAEGFVGDDEPMWAKRPIYARRAMAQTRAISRACRSAFAHVVVLMDAGLSTTPAEEVPHGGFQDEHEPPPQPKPELSDEEKKAKTLTAFAAFFGDEANKVNTTPVDFAKAFAVVVSNGMTGNIADYDLEDLLAFWKQRKQYAEQTAKVLATK